MYDRSAQDLYDDKCVQCNSNTVVWICQRPLESNGLKAQHNKRCCKKQCHDLKPDVDAQRKSRIAMVEAGHEDGSRHNKEEGDGREDTMGGDERLVRSHVAKTIAHAWKVSK